jgi:hypothetical protein
MRVLRSLCGEDGTEASESLWQCAAEWIVFPPDSRIISHFPEIFAEFLGEQFSFLWRGSRDGFGAKEFHRLCDGRANTLSVILDTEGTIFGGFAPVEWESRKPWPAEEFSFRAEQSVQPPDGEIRVGG